MFEYTSRYYPLEDRTLRLPEGHVIAYKGRRFLPALNKQRPLTQMIVNESDRLDLIADRLLGSSLQYWQIADVNLEMYPKHLTEKIGTMINVPVTSFEG